MAESVALVPVPFYAPARTGTGSFFTFDETPRHPLLLAQRVCMAAPQPDKAMAYNRDGCLVVDTMIGTVVNIHV